MKMNLLILIVLIIATFNVSAGIGDSAGGNSMRLFQDRNLQIDIPKIRFKDNYVLDISKVCLEQSEIRSIKKYPIYQTIFDTNSERDERRRIKVGEEYKTLVNEYSDGTLKYPTEYKNIPVRKKQNSFRNRGFSFGNKKGKVLFYEDFAIDYCDQLNE